MTSKLTREWLQHQISAIEAVGITDSNTLAAFKLALAAMDSEPVADVVAWSHPTEERTCDIRWRRHDVEPGPLYRYAQPAPGISFFSEGIETAACWIDKQREAFDNEHGQRDPDTYAFEFRNAAAQEYSDTLAELAEGIRALHPNAGMQPAPVVPDFQDVLESLDYEVRCNVRESEHVRPPMTPAAPPCSTEVSHERP